MKELNGKIAGCHGLAPWRLTLAAGLKVNRSPVKQQTCPRA
jgi:hypothetical protein